MSFIEEINKAIVAMAKDEPKGGLPTFFTAGTGIPDMLAIEFFKLNNIIVICRDGTEYLKGKKRS